MQKIVDIDSHRLWIKPNKNRIYCTMTGKGELLHTPALIQDLCTRCWNIGVLEY